VQKFHDNPNIKNRILFLKGGVCSFLHIEKLLLTQLIIEWPKVEAEMQDGKESHYLLQEYLQALDLQQQ
jgi:hypothetical protein